MRRFQCALLGAVAVIGFGSLASAADLPTKAPVYQAAPVAVYNWNGFYIGGNVGYGWATSGWTAQNANAFIGNIGQTMI